MVLRETRRGVRGVDSEKDLEPPGKLDENMSKVSSTCYIYWRKLRI